MTPKGFTLIELLITITIISILAAIGLAAYREILLNARDTSRKQDLLHLATALTIYFQKNGSYILSPVAAIDSCSRDTAFFYSSSGIASYMQNNIVPKDPKTLLPYCYIAVNDGQDFRLFARLENCRDPAIIPGIDCRQAFWNYSVVSENITVTPAP